MLVFASEDDQSSKDQSVQELKEYVGNDVVNRKAMIVSMTDYFMKPVFYKAASFSRKGVIYQVDTKGEPIEEYYSFIISQCKNSIILDDNDVLRNCPFFNTSKITQKNISVICHRTDNVITTNEINLMQQLSEIIFHRVKSDIDFIIRFHKSILGSYNVNDFNADPFNLFPYFQQMAFSVAQSESGYCYFEFLTKKIYTPEGEIIDLNISPVYPRE
jgi:hypothetical protein